MLTDLQTQTATDRVVLKRGPQLMVLFRGSPLPTDIDQLQEAGVAIGLALAPGELPTLRSLDAFRYVFVSTGRRGRPALAEAVSDLELNNWSIDIEPNDAAVEQSHSRRQLVRV